MFSQAGPIEHLTFARPNGIETRTQDVRVHPLGGDGQGVAESVGTSIAVTPAMPIKEEVIKHNVAHQPYRSWRRWCVAGTLDDKSHRRTRAKRDTPTFSMD